MTSSVSTREACESHWNLIKQRTPEYQTPWWPKNSNETQGISAYFPTLTTNENGDGIFVSITFNSLGVTKGLVGSQAMN